MNSATQSEIKRVRFSIPLLPPSVNSCWRKKARGGFYLTKEANAFIYAVGMLAPKGVVEGKFYEVELLFRMSLGNILRLDLDNLLKVSIDSLAKAGVIRDDRYVRKIFACKTEAASRAEEGTEFNVIGVTGQE